MINVAKAQWKNQISQEEINELQPAMRDEFNEFR